MTSTYLLLEHIEVVNDDTNEEVESDEGAHNDEADKVPVVPEASISVRLLINVPWVCGISDQLHPAFKCGLYNTKLYREVEAKYKNCTVSTKCKMAVNTNIIYSKFSSTRA